MTDRVTSDDTLMQGYSNPIRTGARTWARSLRTLTITIAPLAGGAALLTLLFGGLAAESGPGLNGSLLLALLAIGTFGLPLVRVVASRFHTGHSGDHAYLHTVQRFVPWLITWLLMIGVTVVGYILLILPGIHFNMRVFWADEFALIHKVSPFKALESWQISRGQGGRHSDWSLSWDGCFSS